MKDRENITAYISKVQEALKKEKKKYESVKDDYSKRMLSLRLTGLDFKHKSIHLFGYLKD